MFFGRRIRPVTIANPCRENWTAMPGGDEQRFCRSCKRSVHDLSALTRRQVAELFSQNAGKLCGRITYDERGNQIFAKERNPFERLIQISVLGASAMATATAASTCDVKVRVVDPTRTAVPNAPVTISKAGAADATGSGKSDDKGEFTGQIPPGTYSLKIDSPGFISFRQELTCKESETVSVEAGLQIGSVVMGDVVEIGPVRHPVWARLRSLFGRH